MAKKRCKYKNTQGFSLVELIVVVSIIGIILAIAGPELSGRIKRSQVKSCAQKLAADIRLARASAQAEGRRAQLVITPDSSLHDFNGDGTNELWLTFLDSNSNSTYNAGETVQSCSTCANGIIIEPNSNLSNSLPLSADGTNRFMWFSTLGTLQASAIDKSIVITSQSDSSYKIRIKEISLTGNLVTQTCEESCTVDCSDENNWKDI